MNRFNRRLRWYMKFVPTYVHGIFDYVIGVFLLLSPTLFGYGGDTGVASILPRVMGVLIICQALLTNYELGLLKILPMRTHLLFDYIIGIFLLLSPWLFSFSEHPANAWLPPVLVGIVGFCLTLVTETVPRQEPVERTIFP